VKGGEAFMGCSVAGLIDKLPATHDMLSARFSQRCFCTDGF
jgi:hypothetical protein